MIRPLAAIISLLSIATCLAAPILYFYGYLSADAFKQLFAGASVLWFISATVWVEQPRKQP